MPFLRVTVDQIEIATVDTIRRDVVAIRVGGTKADDEYADLDVTGGRYDHQGTTEHRVWVDQMPLKIGQVVGVSFIADAVQTGDGKTLDELYPDRREAGTVGPVNRVELAEELRRAEKKRSGYEVRLVLPNGSARNLSTAPDEHGFGFSVLWNNLHPERVSVSLHAYTLDTIAVEAPGRTVAREKIPLGDAVRLELIC